MTDGWGDASGIEGNYEDADDEATSTEMNTEQQSEDASGTTTTNDSEATSETRETNVTKTNIKDEWNGRTIYIPDPILDDLEDTYLESQLKLRKAGRTDFKKNRHFYPLLVEFGIEALSQADAEEIQSRLSELGEN